MKWYFHLRGQSYAYGPIGPMTEKEVRTYIKITWGNGRNIPPGTQIWKA